MSLPSVRGAFSSLERALLARRVGRNLSRHCPDSDIIKGHNGSVNKRMREKDNLRGKNGRDTDLSRPLLRIVAPDAKPGAGTALFRHSFEQHGAADGDGQRREEAAARRFRILRQG